MQQRRTNLRRLMGFLFLGCIFVWVSLQLWLNDVLGLGSLQNKRMNVHSVGLMVELKIIS
jgi:hypothetical protein